MEKITERLDRIEELLRLQAIHGKQALNTEEAALWLGISPDRLRHLASDREIAYYKSGKRLWFRTSDLEAYVLDDATRRDTRRELEIKAASLLFKNTKQKTSRI